MRTFTLEALRARAGALSKRVPGPARVLGAALAAALLALPSALSAQTNPARYNIDIAIQGVGGVSDLAAQTGSSVGEINLTWTEPFHAGATPPFTYDLRVSTVANIADNAEFAAAQPLTALSGTPIPAPGAGGGQAAVVVTGLTPGVVHFFALREVDSLGVFGAWTRLFGTNASNSAAAKTINPAPITDLTGLAGPGVGQVSLAWTAPAPPVLVSYRIYYATFSVASVGGSTSTWRSLAASSSTVVVPTAVPGAVQNAVLSVSPADRWYFGVETTNTSGLGPLDSLSASAQVNARARGLGPVTDLVAAPGPLSTGVNLTWTEPFVSSVTAPVSYQIKVSTLGFIDNDADFAAARDLQSISTITIPAYGGGGGAVNVGGFGLQPFTTHYFAVRLVEGSTPTLAGTWLRVPGSRNTSASAVPLFVPNPPDPVSDLTALPGAGEGDVTLVWTAPSNANLAAIASYEVRFATFPAASVGSTTTWHAAASSQAFAPALPAGSVETRTIGGLFPAATWYFSVKSIDITGSVSPIDTKSTGAFQAATLPRSVAPSVPAGLAVAAGVRRVDASWTDLTPAGKGLDFAYYRLERSTDAVSYVQLTTTTGTGFVDYPLKAQVTHYYRLYARDLRGNESAATPVASTVPFTILPMEPLGVSVAATSTTVTLSWNPVTRFADGTPFISTAAPVADELIGYTVYRSSDGCGPSNPFVHVSSLPFITTNLLDNTGGLNFFYHINAYNSLGLSTNTLTVSALGERRFYLDQCENMMVFDAVNAAVLNGATNGRGADIRIAKVRRPQDVGGPVFQSAEWRAFLNGVVELKGFALPKPARVVLHYDMSGGSVVPSTAPTFGVSAYVPAAAAPAAGDPKNLGMYWDNGAEFKKLYGTVDALNQTVTVESPNLGVYQIRSLFRADGAVFDLSNVSNRVITPNGDGLNDQVIFTYDPGPRNAPVRGRVYDMTGQFVADMTAGLVPNTLVWDGRMNGRAAAGGVYVYKIEGDGKTYTGTVVVAR